MLVFSGVKSHTMPDAKNIIKIITGFIKNETYPSLRVSNKNKISVKIPLDLNNSVFSFSAIDIILFQSSLISF